MGYDMHRTIMTTVVYTDSLSHPSLVLLCIDLSVLGRTRFDIMQMRNGNANGVKERQNTTRALWT
jgi:hypothetical protein